MKCIHNPENECGFEWCVDSHCIYESEKSELNEG